MSSKFDHGGTVFAVARELGVAPEEILDFSASINPLGPAPGVREALAAAFDRLGHYPDDTAAELTAALAAWHGLDPAQVGVANGSTELIYLLPRLVAGSRALVVAPPFSEYAKSLSRAGWQVDYFFLSPDDSFALSLSALTERLATGYDLLILANPGNPTGALVPLAQVAGLLEACQQAGMVAISIGTPAIGAGRGMVTRGVSARRVAATRRRPRCGTGARVDPGRGAAAGGPAAGSRPVPRPDRSPRRAPGLPSLPGAPGRAA
ncbi:MAG TPA: aminotransferase class I/II-fold pyridoxal phosphate-dependent enzyme, partial [Geobacteraceae bacterium]